MKICSREIHAVGDGFKYHDKTRISFERNHLDLKTIAVETISILISAVDKKTLRASTIINVMHIIFLTHVFLLNTFCLH